jgi:geranylgeranyl pyrophosphate synthase
MESEIKRLVRERLGRGEYEKFLYSFEGGKRVRPLLIKLICEKFGRDFSPLLKAMAAVEVFHSSTLMHDDIVDREKTRRGRAPFYRKFSTKSAVLFGDLFAALSLDMFFESGYPKELGDFFIRTMREMAEGQLMEMNGSIRDMKSYMEYIDKKTASLFLLAAKIPLVVFGLKDRKILEFAREFGRLFQIANDLEGGQERNSILSFLPRKEAEQVLAEKLRMVEGMGVLDVKALLGKRLAWVAGLKG